MTDAEMSKAVADACGIEVTVLWDGRVHRKNSDFWFQPTNDWNDAMLVRSSDGWHVSYRVTVSDRVQKTVGVTNERGPRAICEAILQVKGVA